MKKAKSIFAVILALVMSLSCFSLVGFAEETATQEHLTEVPEGYVGIYTKEDLDNIKLDMAGKYILMNDIVFDDSDYEKGGSFYNSGKGWEPIGTTSTYFNGIFDGNGYSIKNLYINSPEQSFIGLFGCVTNSTIKNISLVNANIIGYNYVGGIVGISKGESTISYCNTHGVISGCSDVGGIAGQFYSGTNSFWIMNCNNIAMISGQGEIGGIVGSIPNYNYYGFIENCSNSGSVTATSDSAGGIVGYSCIVHVDYCYNIGDVGSPNYTGGILGRTGNNVYAYHCYSVGTVTATSNFGGCFGDAPNSVTFCYYLDEAVTNPICTSGVAKSEDQLRKQSTFERWDFDTVWTMGGREDYPYPELKNVPLILPEDYAHKHEYTAEITTPATHLAEGIMTYTCECGDSYTEVIEQITEHSYETTVTSPTCTEEGYTTFTCECGDTYVDDYVSAVGHNFVGTVTSPTCTEQGYTTYTCECGETYTRDYVSASGHTYTSEITTPATHTATGVMTYTCTCGDSYTEEIAKTIEHTYTAVVTAPTCDDKGYTTYTCACGDTYVDNYVDATGHNANGDDVCDNCGETVEVEDSTDDCSCNCHKSGISNFFFKFALFFQKLFGSNKICACGVAHY